MNREIITDADRYPTLTSDGRQILKFLREHPHAPIFRNESGNRLTADDVSRVRKFEQDASRAEIGWHLGEMPRWLGEFIGKCFVEVPFYRRYGSVPSRFEDLPTITRADIGNDIAQFVPDTAPLDRLINFRTSGTTGHPLVLASHPVVAASYLTFHKRALRRFGIELNHGRGQVGVVLVGFQRECFTYASVTPTMDESGLVKLNLHPTDWRDPDDRAKYFDAIAAEVYTGDPLAFAELLNLPLQTRPRALISTSMTLLPAMRRRLEEHFECPVLDLYSMNEAGPIAVADVDAGGHTLLQHQLYIEILDETGHALPSGERGEVALTGGFNFCLPLLRYRTGDYAALRYNGQEPVLVDLEGRPPIRFRNRRGEWLNNIEVTHALRRVGVPQYTLHQYSDGRLSLRWSGASCNENQLRTPLEQLFGVGQPLELTRVDSFEGKTVQYTSEVLGAQSGI
ncbi:MAG TPA: AMP-binding protein [Verrucomicrobiae bacterium]|jgi:phenylacetate-CoA ligase|nr:AMP-binding protein [Verrucomicrobiae bacterium]